jgi:uncharacterized membrane protein HdeD (DUF308 family)
MHNAIQYWWAMVAQGVLSVVIGMLAIFYPGPALLAAALVFGAYAFVDGVLLLISAFAGRRGRRPGGGWIGLGILGVAVGALTFSSPMSTVLALVYALAAWSIARGILQIAAAVELRRVIENEWLLITTGFISISYGILVLLLPLAGIVAMAWMFGVYSVASGVLLISLGLSFKPRVSKEQPAQPTPVHHDERRTA